MKAILPALCLSVAIAAAGVGARADGPFNLGPAGPGNFAVLGLGSPTNVSITGPSSVSGAVANIGVPASGNFSMSDGKVGGTVYLNTASKPNTSGPSVITGGIVQNAATDARLASAVTAAKNTSSTYAALAATITSPTSINQNGGNQTIYGGPGVNVLTLSSVVMNGTANLYLNAPAGAFFVLNITGKFSLNSQSHIKVAGGLAPLAVLYNIIGAGEQVAFSGGLDQTKTPNSSVDGILLAPQRDIALSPGLVNGEIIGGGKQITITSGGELKDQSGPGTVSGTLFCDENANSVFDVGDDAIAGTQVSLMSGTTVVATMTSDANGLYKFTGVAPGTYTVHVPGSNTDRNLETANDASVTVAGNQDVTGVNFGYVPTPINFLLENGTPMLGAPQPGGVPLTQGSLFGQAFFVPDLAHVSDLTALGAGSVPGATIGLSDLFTAAPGLYAYSGPLPDFPELGTYTGFVFLYEPLLSADAWHNTSVTNLIAVLHSAGASGDLVNDTYTFRFQTNQVFAGPGTAYNYQATGVTVLEDTPVSGAFIGIKTDAAFLLNPVYVGASLTPVIPLGKAGSAGIIPPGWMARAIGEFTVSATPSRINVHFSGTYQNICGDLFGFEICPPAWLGQ